MNMKMNKLLIISLFLITSCNSLSPGMNMDINNTWLDEDNDFVFISDEANSKIFIESIDKKIISELSYIGEKPYKIGIGDKLSIVVWGLPDVFPQTNLSQDMSLRVVNTDGTIFFPYVGSVRAIGKTQVDLRNELTKKLSDFFNEPQLDVSIAKFESQKVYLLGEVTQPQKLPITETPLSLADALGLVKGLNTNTSAADQVFVIRHIDEKSGNARIFRADLSSPANFLLASEFYLYPQDIIYVNAKGTTRWNRVISQFFPFSSFLNSVDNLTSD